MALFPSHDGCGLSRAAKDAGNTAYGASQFERAVKAYTDGLEADVEGCLSTTLLGNRSQAYVKIGEVRGTARTHTYPSPPLL